MKSNLRTYHHFHRSSAQRRLSLFFAVSLTSCVATQAFAQEQNPFSKFAGTWRGSGLIHLNNNKQEGIRCRGTFSSMSIPNLYSLRLEMRCAGDSYNFDLQSNLNYQGGAVTGSFNENVRGINGNVAGSLNGDVIQGNIDSQSFAATLEIMNFGDKQQIRIQSPGGEISAVLIGLVRSGSQPAAVAQPTQ